MSIRNDGNVEIRLLDGDVIAVFYTVEYTDLNMNSALLRIKIFIRFERADLSCVREYANTEKTRRPKH